MCHLKTGKTRKAIDLKSLGLNCTDITQSNIKCNMSSTVSKVLTYYLIQSYLLKGQICYTSAINVLLRNI